MRATLTAVIAAIEAGAVALAGLVCIAVPAVLLWVITFGLDASPMDVVAVIVSVWFLAHGVPLDIAVSAETALGLELPGEAFSFTVSLAPLGLALITVVLALRAGWRFASRGGSGAAGVVGGGIGFAAVAFAVLPVTGEAVPEPRWIAVLTPGLVYACSMLVTFVMRAALTEQEWFTRSIRGLQQAMKRVSPPLASVFPARATETLRLAAGALAALIALAAAGFTISLIIGYVDITALSQNLQLDPLGAIVLFLVQLAFLPVALIWSLAWFTGSGFAVGVGTSVSPFDALVGPIPALPLMGAIPPSWGSFAPIAPALVVIAGLAVGVAAARRTALRSVGWVAAILVPAAAAALAGLAVTLLAVLASGAMGPDRLALAGPDPWATGGLAAAELGGGLILGVVAGRADAARVGALVTAMRGSGSGASAEAGRSEGFGELESLRLASDDALRGDDADGGGDAGPATRSGGVRSAWAGTRSRLAELGSGIAGGLGFGGSARGGDGGRGDAPDDDVTEDLGTAGVGIASGADAPAEVHVADAHAGDAHATDDRSADERDADDRDADDSAGELGAGDPDAAEPDAAEPDGAADLPAAGEPDADESGADADLPDALDDVTEDELRVSEDEAEAILAAFSWDGGAGAQAEERWPSAPAAGENADDDARGAGADPKLPAADEPEDGAGGTERRSWRMPWRKR